MDNQCGWRQQAAANFQQAIINDAMLADTTL
jgi:hypothetical protein